MKLPITDKFLLDIFDYTEKLDKAAYIFSYKTLEEAYCPSIYDLKNECKKKKDRKQFRQLIYRLKRNGFIKIKNLEQNKGVILTKKGTEKVLKAKFKIRTNQKRSDHRWQMIIFDIPEEKRYLRDLLRNNLRLLGYKLLQQSIWVCPYDVFQETESFLRKYSLDPYVRLFLIDEIEM